MTKLQFLSSFYSFFCIYLSYAVLTIEVAVNFLKILGKKIILATGAFCNMFIEAVFANVIIFTSQINIFT